MRIVHLVGFYSPELGYQESYLAEQHARMGHEVHVIASDRPYPFPNIKKIMKDARARLEKEKGRNDSGVKVPRLNSWRVYADLILLFGIKKKLREIRPDVVFAHESRQSPPYYAGMWKKELGYVLVTDQHDFHHHIPKHSLAKKLLREIDYVIVRNPMVRKALKRSDGIIAVTRETKAYLKKQFKLKDEDVALVELGVDEKAFTNNPKARLRIRKAHGIKDSDVAFAFAGTIVRRKGIEMLIEAFAKMANMDSRLMIIGDGEEAYMEELKQLSADLGVQDSVIFTGFVPKAELPEFFSAADVGVWPGNNSVIIMEAMACGLPVIMVDLQLSHLVGYNNGMKFHSGDLAELQSCMQKMMDTRLRKKLAGNSRKACEKNYSYASIARQFLEVAKKAGEKRHIKLDI